MSRSIFSDPLFQKLVEFIDPRTPAAWHLLHTAPPVDSEAPPPPPPPLPHAIDNPFSKHYAATKIQRAFRHSRTAKLLSHDGHGAYSGKMPDSLHEAMLGRYIAPTKPSRHLPFTNPTAETTFYHREDILWQDHEKHNVLKQLLKKHRIIPKKGLTYIPIHKSAHLPPHEVIRRCGIADSASTAYEDEHVFIISCPDRLFQHSSDAASSYSRIGLQASHWGLGTSLYDHEAVEERKHDGPLPKLLAFKRSEPVQQLKQLSKNRALVSHPIYHAASNLLAHLPDSFDDRHQSLARLKAVLPSYLAKKHNYQSASELMNLVVHELALHCAHTLQQRNPIVPFADVVEQSRSHTLKTLGITAETYSHLSPQTDYRTSISHSGANAFAVAVDLARHMQRPYYTPTSTADASPLYFEFSPYVERRRTPFGILSADIYLIGMVSQIDQRGLLHTPDSLNDILIDIINSQGKPEYDSPITLVIDATAAPKDHLILDPYFQKLIGEGAINIIIARSHQKFGLFHADNVQGGQVDVLCHQDAFPKTVLDQFQHDAEHDYLRSVDAQVIAYLHQHAHQALALVRDRHYDNGRIFQGASVPLLKQNRYILQGGDPDQNLFLVIDKVRNNALYRACKAITPFRDSFGFGQMTQNDIGDLIRLSPGASDDIDSLIDAAKLYFAMQFDAAGNAVAEGKPATHYYLFNIVQQKEDLTVPQQIATLALLRSLTQRLTVKSSNYRHYDATHIILATEKLRHQATGLRGRTEMQALLKDVYQLKVAMAKKFTHSNLGSHLSAVSRAIHQGFELKGVRYSNRIQRALAIIYQLHKPLYKGSNYCLISRNEDLAAKITQLHQVSPEFMPAFIAIESATHKALSLLLSPEQKLRVTPELLSITLEPFMQKTLAALYTYSQQPLSDIDITALNNLLKEVCRVALTVTSHEERQHQICSTMSLWVSEKKSRGLFSSTSKKRHHCLKSADILPTIHGKKVSAAQYLKEGDAIRAATAKTAIRPHRKMTHFGH